MTTRELVGIPSFAEEVEEGLAAHPKWLPSKLFYDGPGSALFEEITRLPEYYLTRTELEILRERSYEIAEAAGANITVVELGAGTATKTGTLLEALSRRQIRTLYVPVDISPSALHEAKTRIENQQPQVHVKPLVADFSQGFGFLRNIGGRKLVLYLGSSIGNFESEAAAAMLGAVRRQLRPGDSLLLGTDLYKDRKILIPAYDDAQGVTAEFNKNILHRLNRELGANFDVDAFQHVVFWNTLESRVEMHLESLRRQRVEFQLLQFTADFAAGETIHTENSYKYTLPIAAELLAEAGFRLERTWLDRRKWFALHLARVETF